MARLKDLASGTSDLFKIDPKIIKVEPGFNVRVENDALAEHIAGLKASIKDLGVQTPLTVRLHNDEVWLVDGHCRLRAVMDLIGEGEEIETVPCIPEGKYASEADRIVALFTRNSGKPLDPVEKAEVFKRLVGFGWSEEKIAQKAGLTTKQVGNILTLGSAPQEVKEMVSAGVVSATTAVRTIQAEGGTQAAETLKEAAQTAQASGKTKVTPKTVKATQTAKSPPKLTPVPKVPKAAKPEDEQDPDEEPITETQKVIFPAPASGPPRSGPAPVETPKLVSMPVMSPARFRQMAETLHAILQTNDIKMAHALAQDALKPRAA